MKQGQPASASFFIFGLGVVQKGLGTESDNFGESESNDRIYLVTG